MTPEGVAAPSCRAAGTQAGKDNQGQSGVEGLPTGLSDPAYFSILRESKSGSDFLASGGPSPWSF